MSLSLKTGSADALTEVLNSLRLRGPGFLLLGTFRALVARSPTEPVRLLSRHRTRRRLAKAQRAKRKRWRSRAAIWLSCRMAKAILSVITRKHRR